MDTSSLKAQFEWSDSGRQLLVKINKSIQEVGGRLKMAEIIMDESLEFFSYKDRVNLDFLISESNRKPHYMAKKPKRSKSEVTWSEKDLIFLKANYGIISLKDLVTVLNRTAPALRTKFERTSTIDEIIERRSYRHYRVNTSITDYKKAESALKLINAA